MQVYTVWWKWGLGAGLFHHVFAVLSTQEKAKGNGSDYSGTDTERLLSCNHFQHAFSSSTRCYLIIYPSRSMQCIYSSSCSVCVSFLTVLGLICRHMLIVNRSSLLLQSLTWCFGSGWACSINIIHLTGMDRDYFKVKQPEWIATDAPIHDIKTCSISGAITAFGCEQLYSKRMCSITVYFHVYLTSCYDPIDILDSPLNGKQVDLSASSGPLSRSVWTSARMRISSQERRSH